MARLKLKGYVLLESMIAMVVIMICFSIALMMYNTIVSGSRAKLNVLARLRMEKAADKAKSGERLLDETVMYDEFNIRQTIITYRDVPDLYELQLTAVTPDGKQVGEYHELIHRP